VGFSCSSFLSLCLPFFLSFSFSESIINLVLPEVKPVKPLSQIGFRTFFYQAEMGCWFIYKLSSINNYNPVNNYTKFHS
jgi:glucan phosphoethanolaminetransferase (alkaline phosphatase superfamily)